MNHPANLNLKNNFGAHQRGVVLLMALIMLVALTLAGIALVRSVDTSNIIAGNLAFKQSATAAGDMGTEDAITLLSAHKTELIGDSSGWATPTDGYYAARRDRSAGQTWDAFFTTFGTNSSELVTQAATGNKVEYVIHRMCSGPGATTTLGIYCSAVAGDASTAGSSSDSGEEALKTNTQVYYRITNKITGPRNTVSYTQTIVAM